MRESRSIKDGRVLQEAEFYAQFIREAQRRLFILVFIDVPLVHDEHDRLARFVGIACDLLVLLGDARRGVEHDEHDVGAVDGAKRSHDAVTLDRRIDLSLASHARRVDEDELRVLRHKVRVDGIARRARNVADDDALLPQECIDERGFADVRTADDGDADLIRLFLFLCSFGKERHESIEQIAKVHGVRSRNRHRIAKAEVIELVDVRLLLGGIDLVHGQEHGFLRRAQHLADFLISKRQARTAVDEKEDDIRLLHGDLRLLAHRAQDDIARIEFDASRIDHREFLTEPFGIKVDAVARDARQIIDDGHALPAQFIEERGLAHVRTSHDRYDRLAHSILSFSSFLGFVYAALLCHIYEASSSDAPR